ncbi:MAG: hypothetical protein DRP62_06570 [Planctomycetota bacterium]|nr:MAG: hypothetical protein DRP62_06570 [Planctomycetota bacterium]
MNTKKLNLLFVILLTLILVGAGCGDSDQVGSPAGDDDDLVIGGDDAEDVEKDSGEVADVEEEDVVVDEFEGWKTYEQDGITLKYPENWRVTEDGLGLYRWYEGLEEDIQTTELGEFNYLVRGKLITLYPVIEDNIDNVTLEEFWEEEKVNDYIKERINIGGEPALTAECSGISYMECILILYGGKKINIVVDYVTDNDFAHADVRRILKTVEFE